MNSRRVSFSRSVAARLQGRYRLTLRKRWSTFPNHRSRSAGSSDPMPCADSLISPQRAQKWSMQLWQLLTLNLWMQIFLDGGGSAAADLIQADKA